MIPSHLEVRIELQGKRWILTSVSTIRGFLDLRL